MTYGDSCSAHIVKNFHPRGFQRLVIGVDTIKSLGKYDRSSEKLIIRLPFWDVLSELFYSSEKYPHGNRSLSQRHQIIHGDRIV